MGPVGGGGPECLDESQTLYTDSTRMSGSFVTFRIVTHTTQDDSLWPHCVT